MMTRPQPEVLFDEALGYLKTLKRSLSRKSKFSNELLYQITAIALEKLFVSLLATHDVNATHHAPLALAMEANSVEPLPERMIATAKLVGRFESICSLTGFGCKMPNDDELRQMILGLLEVRDHVAKRVHPSLQPA